MNNTCSTNNQRERVYLNKRCDKADLDSIELIQNRISCAYQAARADAIPDGVSEEAARAFIQAAIESLAQYKWLEQQWWKEAKRKYDLPSDSDMVVWVDFETGDFYTFR